MKTIEEIKELYSKCDRLEELDVPAEAIEPLRKRIRIWELEVHVAAFEQILDICMERDWRQEWPELSHFYKPQPNEE